VKNTLVNAEATELDGCDCDRSEGKEERGPAGHGMGSGACLPWSGVLAWCDGNVCFGFLPSFFWCDVEREEKK
jgi:hypothetical protein